MTFHLFWSFIESPSADRGRCFDFLNSTLALSAMAVLDRPGVFRGLGSFSVPRGGFSVAVSTHSDLREIRAARSLCESP